MSEDQGSKEYSFRVVTFPKAVPPLPQNRATIPRDFAVGNGLTFSSVSSTHSRWPFEAHPSPEIPQNNTFVPPLAYQEASLAPYEPRAHRGGYAQYYGSITPSDGTTHQTPYGTATATSNGPPTLDIPFGGIAENTAPSESHPKCTRQDLNDAGHNPVVPGLSMANLYGDLAVRFVNDPQSNVIIIRMESSGGRSRVMIELEIVDAA